MTGGESLQAAQPEKSTLPNYRWIKFEFDYLIDPDFMQLSDAAAGVFLKLYLLAGKSDAGGLLCNSQKAYSSKDLAWHLRKDNVMDYLEELTRAGFLTPDGEGWRITRFLDEQGPGTDFKRQQWREQQRRHRERAGGVVDSDHGLDKDSDQEKIRKDLEKNRSVSMTSGAVMLTQQQPSQPTKSSAPDFRVSILKVWENFTGIKPGPDELEKIRTFFEVNPTSVRLQTRLSLCADFWKSLSDTRGFSGTDTDAIISLYPEGALEARAAENA